MKKKDYKYLSFIFFLYLTFITYITKFYKYLYGTNTWLEITKISDIIRNNTKLLFFGPNYSLNLGKDLYNYYNLITNPIIRIGSIFKFIPIELYLIITTIICLIISNYLLYKLLRNKKYSRELSLLSTFIFTLSSTITYATYNDITIIHFIMFLLLSLHSLNIKKKTNQNWLFTISIFLMITTNIYLFIPSILVLITYYLSLYFHNKKRINYKSFLKEIFFLLTPLFLGILLSSRIVLPIITLIINKELIFNTYHSNILYSPYGIGITIILIPSIINYFKLTKERIITTILILLSFLLSTYNTLYLIVYLPLYILLITEFIKDLTNKNINYSKLFIIIVILSLLIYLKTTKIIYLIDLYTLLLIVFIYNKTNKKNLFYILLFIVSLTNCYINTPKDNLVLRNNPNKEEINNILKTLTTNDKTIYRINNEIPYNTYNNYLIDNIDNPFEELITNKYIITKKYHLEYKLLKEINNIKIYQNNNTLPLVYLSSNIMNYEEYNKLNSFQQKEVLLNTIITEDLSNNDYISNIKDTNITIKDIFNTDNDIYYYETDEIVKIDYELPYKYQNKLLYITLDSNQELLINSIKSNKEFIIDEPITKLEIVLYPGKYKISNLHISYIDIDKLETNTKLIKKLNIDTITNNVIELSTNIQMNSYLVITLPYSKYYKIYLNEKEEPYEIINNKYIGIKLKKGNYDIRIVYYGPYYTLSILMTMFSFIIYFVIVILELERRI